MGVLDTRFATRLVVLVLAAALVSSCGRVGNFLGGPNRAPKAEEPTGNRTTIWRLFDNRDDPNTTLEVNKYLWNASLDVLNFLPIQSADPFSGVIVTGYGTPPGSSRAYRATIYIRDPALEARSLNVALASRSGPVSADTVRAVEDAILTRARQLRQRDLDL